MKQPADELFEISEKLVKVADEIELATIAEPLQLLESAADKLSRSFSGSWLGYHSRVYYSGLRPTPVGAHFSQEWGLKNLSYTGLGTVGEWQEYEFDSIIQTIQKLAKNPDISMAAKASLKAEKIFDQLKSDILSIIETQLSRQNDAFLSKLKLEIEELKPQSKSEVTNYCSPKGQLITRDAIATGQGLQTPPHIDVLAEVISIRTRFGVCRTASEIARKAASHIERLQRGKNTMDRIGTNVFIGHGRSPLWRELKDFVQDRLALPWDEFNRVPVAGVTNIARLSEMLDAAAIAFLVMTAEDETTDGTVQARMNVAHEAGLFQGRLGFMKAILLLEEGCSEFTNIQGLGQIRFPTGNISAAFEDIRQVLEREGLIK